jgi:hypothetical protein
MRKLLFLFLFSLLAMPLLAAVPVMADVTYNYTGNAFTTGATGGYATPVIPSLGTNITISVDFGSAITGNFTGELGWNNIVSLTVTSANSSPVVTSNAIPDNCAFYLVDGVMVSWVYQTGTSGYILSTYGGLETGGGLGKGQDAIWNYNVYPATVNYNSNSLGTWTKAGSPSAAPIPGTVWLLGSGLAGLAAFRRKFRAA